MGKNPFSLADFVAKVKAAQSSGRLVSLRLHPHQGPPVDVRPVDLTEGPVLSFVVHEERRDLTRNHAPDLALGELETLLQEGGTAWLRTVDTAWQWVAAPGRRPRLVRHTVDPKHPPNREHDRTKQRRIAASPAWMRALDLTDEDGRPRPGRTDKIRQIERYADVLAHLIRAGGWTEGQRVTLVDMGCGKGYLTFAAWHLLRHTLALDAQVSGLDVRADVIGSATRAAQAAEASGLSFAVGTIASAALPSVDILVALHACNDATDHALRAGVRAGARVIVVAPCCHKDVRRVLGAPPPLGPLLEHGLFKERFAEWLTDGLRVLALEAAGYRVTVSEFVDAVHTPKNVLIGAVLGNHPDRRAAARADYQTLKAWAGLPALAMDLLA